MSGESRFEHRLAAVEAAVADLQNRVPSPPSRGNWLERIIGTFKDEPAFDQVIAYGREMREEDRPQPDREP